MAEKNSFFHIREEVASLYESVKDDILRNLAAIGEECVTYARQIHPNNWGDRTGNLRSSIGYVVLWNGEPVTDAAPVAYPVAPGYRTERRIRKRKDGTRVEYMAKVKVGGSGEAGAKQGQKLLDELKSKYPKGAVLILVAGMNYASYVESVHHKDVLTGAGLLGEEKILRLLDPLLEK